MTSVLFLGFLIGMQHALEADHLAAVASLATRARSAGQMVKQGAVWGLGHSLTLLFFGSLVIFFGNVLSERLAAGLEFAVGVMLILLGADVLRRLIRDRVHFHLHRHDGDLLHFHAHSHALEQGRHDPEHHRHKHETGLPLRALFVGMMHGMAGSAALLLLTLSAVQSPVLAIFYILMFGAGSILGMAAFSAVIVVPLTYSARLLTWSHRALHGTIGSATLALGGWVIFQAGG